MWRVIKNSNARRPPYEVFSVPVGRPAPKDAEVLWEGEATSRQEAWDLATKAKPALLAKVPIPDPFASVDVFARLAPKRDLKNMHRRPVPNAKRPPPEPARNLSAAERIFNEICSSKTGLTCAEVETTLSLKHQTASPRVHELAKAGCIQIDGKRGKPSSDVYVQTPGATFALYRGEGATVSDPKSGDPITARCLDAIMAFAFHRGHEGVTGQELTDAFNDLTKGTIEGTFAYTKRFRWMVRHPENLTRDSRNGKPLEVFIINTSDVPEDELKRFRAMAEVGDFPQPGAPRSPKATKKAKVAKLITEFLGQCGAAGATMEEASVYASEHGAPPDFPWTKFVWNEMRRFDQIHPTGHTRPAKNGKALDVCLLGPAPTAGAGDPSVALKELSAWTQKHKGLRSGKFAKVFEAVEALLTNGSSHAGTEAVSTS